MRFSALMVLALGTAPVWVHAEPVFLQQRVNDPLNLLAAVPALSAPRTESLQLQVSATHANVFSGGSAVNASGGGESLILDGAISQLEFRGQLPLGSCYSAAFDSRLVHHSGGVFDAAIEDWHNFFGLPNGGRENRPRDELLYVISNTGTIDPAVTDFTPNQTEFSNVGTALGDLWLSVQRPIVCGAQRSSNGQSGQDRLGHIRLGVKLPIGSTSGWGSGGQTAVFADWHSAPNHISERTRVTLSLGASYSDEFDERFAALDQRRLQGYGSVVFDYRFNDRFQSLIQFDFRSAAFDSELTELGSVGGQLHIGLRASLARHHRLEVSFSEDVIVDTAPDIGVRLAYTFVP